MSRDFTITISESGDLVNQTVAIQHAGTIRRISLNSLHAKLGEFLTQQSAAIVANQKILDYIKIANMLVVLKDNKVVRTVNVYPGATRSVRYHSTEYMMDCPPLVVTGKWNAEGILTLAEIFILPWDQPLPIITPASTVIAPWPWSNVYLDGHVCWGSATTRGITPDQPQMILDTFFGAPFNMDLWSNQSVVLPDPEDLEDPHQPIRFPIHQGGISRVAGATRFSDKLTAITGEIH